MNAKLNPILRLVADEIDSARDKYDDACRDVAKKRKGQTIRDASSSERIAELAQLTDAKLGERYVLNAYNLNTYEDLTRAAFAAGYTKACCDLFDQLQAYLKGLN